MPGECGATDCARTIRCPRSGGILPVYPGSGFLHRVNAPGLSVHCAPFRSFWPWSVPCMPGRGLPAQRIRSRGSRCRGRDLCDFNRHPIRMPGVRYRCRATLAAAAQTLTYPGDPGFGGTKDGIGFRVSGIAYGHAGRGGLWIMALPFHGRFVSVLQVYSWGLSPRTMVIRRWNVPGLTSFLSRMPVRRSFGMMVVMRCHWLHSTGSSPSFRGYSARLSGFWFPAPCQ